MSDYSELVTLHANLPRDRRMGYDYGGSDYVIGGCASVGYASDGAGMSQLSFAEHPYNEYASAG